MRKWLPIVVVLGLGIAVAGGAILRADDDEGDEKEGARKSVEAVLSQVKVNLADAVKTAEAAAGGKAVAARLEAEDDELAYEVLVFVKKDAGYERHEVDVDARTGKVIEDEKEGAEDDDHGKGDDDDGEEDDGD